MTLTDLCLPLKFSPAGDVLTTNGRDLVVAWAMRTLCAEPGSTPFWRRWGVGVESHLGVNEVAARASLAAKIRAELSAHEAITGVEVGISPGGNGRLTVSVTLALASGERATLSAEVK